MFLIGLRMESKSDQDVKESIFHLPKSILVKKRNVWPTRIVSYIFGFYFLYCSYTGYFSGYISFSRYSYSYTEDAFGFFLLVFGYLLIAISVFWQSLKVKAKT
jgi:O-antigen/teichoic acid export membrane protein